MSNFFGRFFLIGKEVGYNKWHTEDISWILIPMSILLVLVFLLALSKNEDENDKKGEGVLLTIFLTAYGAIICWRIGEMSYPNIFLSLAGAAAIFTIILGFSIRWWRNRKKN